MKRCLCPGHLLCLGGRSSYSPYRSVIVRQQRLLSCLRRGPPSRTQWSRPFSTSVARTVDRSLRECIISKRPGCPLKGKRQKNPDSWLPLLEEYLPQSLRVGTESKGGSRRPPKSMYTRAHDLSTLLMHAKSHGKFEPLTHLGFGKNRWAAVYALLSQLVDATESVLEESTSRPSLSGFDWGAVAGISLDELTNSYIEPGVVKRNLDSQDGKKGPTFKELTERSPANEFSQHVMVEVWQSLGSILLEAADRPPNESNLAMSCVFRILARLHHSGAISDNVYKYTRPCANQATFRPPGMHLLSTHIMRVLSEAAWRNHEAEVTAKAAAAGEDSPYLPFKMGVRDLGPEIWLEFVLWCCVEHGYPKAGLWILNQMNTRTGDLAWKFRSWGPLLHDQGAAVHKTNIDLEEVWRRPGNNAPDAQTPRSHNGGSSSFHGLGKRTISVEVVASVRDSLFNFVYLGVDYLGYSPTLLLALISNLNSFISPPVSDEAVQPTTKEFNWLAVRFHESGVVDSNEDPHAFDRFLRASPRVMPPWDDNPSCFEEDLERLTPSQLYDETSAFTGMMEHNVRSFALHRQTGLAFSSFVRLHQTVDASKSQHIQKFLEQVSRSDAGDLPFLDEEEPPIPQPVESSIPQVSNVTYAHLLDLATTSRAFPFAEWLLFSTDLDGPAIRRSSYGNQDLAPSILRFAAAIRHRSLHRQVVRSLSQPFSLNTLRALINYQISTWDWDSIVPMLEYIRDNRLKSWGHSNVTMLAATIIRMDNVTRHQSGAVALEAKKTLETAKQILTRILQGEFNDLSERTVGNKFQRRAIRNLQRVFQSIPGPLSEIAVQTWTDFAPNRVLPYIPSVAFHHLLSAVVDVHGSAAGQRLWEQWCLHPKSPSYRRIREGGISRLYANQELDPRQGNPFFDPAWFSLVYEKATVPNLNTVRIIAQRAVQEYTQFTQERGSLSRLRSSDVDSDAAADVGTDVDDPDVDLDAADPGDPTIPIPAPLKAKGQALEDVLNFCIAQFQTLRLPENEINRETQGHLHRVKKRKETQANKQNIERSREKERLKKFMQDRFAVEPSGKQRAT